MTRAGWERLGGDTRGTVSALVSAPDVTFATTPVGVYQSRDTGRSWQFAGRQASVAFGECVAVEGSTVYVGAPDGLYRSADSGQTWECVLVGSTVTCVCVGAGVVLAGTDTDGVLRSEDGGRSWLGANAGLLDLEVLALSVSPGFRADRLAFVGTASGLYRSRNGGDSWRAVDTGLTEPGVQCLAIARDRLVVVGTDGDGVLCSADGGATWEQPSELTERSVRALAISPRGTIAAATDTGTFVSFDHGQSWRLNTTGPTGILTLLYLEDGVLLAGADRTAVWRSQDDGATWTESAAGLDASLLSTLIAAPTQGVWLAGSSEGVRRWHAGRWQQCNHGLPDTTVLGLAVADEMVFAATPNGLFASDTHSPLWKMVLPDPVRAVSATPHLVLAVTEDVVSSADLGRTWRVLESPFEASNIISLAADVVATSEPAVWRLSPDDLHWELLFKEAVPRTTQPMATSSAGVFIGLDRRVLSPVREVTEFDATVTAICVSSNGAVWVGTTNGVFFSRDDGKTYDATAGGPRRVIAIAAAAGWVYALELGGQLWRCPDSG